MKEIIIELTRAFEKVSANEESSIVDAIVGHLQDSSFTLIKDLPISIVHKREKLKDTAAGEYLLANDFFDDAGCSATT